MNKQPVFLKLGINYPEAQKRRDSDRLLGYAYLAALAISIALNIYLLWH